MSTSHAQELTLRPDRLEFKRLAWAFGLSVVLHLLVWGGYEGGKKLGLWEKLHLPAWVQQLTQLLTRAPKPEQKPPPPPDEPPLMFVNVNPATATTEAPKNAVAYSDKNAQAANPTASKDTNIPEITGNQTQVVRTEDAKESRYDKLQPAQPAEKAQPEEHAAPKPAVNPGELTLAKPETKPREDDGTAEQRKPRTLLEARMRQPANQIRGERMKQTGGVRRRLETSSLDTKSTAFGAYDAAFITAVQQRWYDLLDSRQYAADGQGWVKVQFRLNYDGRISDMKVLENTVNETLSLLCQKAVLDPAPFEKWPREMRLMVGRDYRELTFKFYYN